jgi:serine/threonine protein kinase
MLGKILSGRYQIIKHFGGGGFGQTYLAEDKQLPGNPRCVVKQLKSQATNPVNLQIARRLFDTEAQVLYRLGNHHQIPQLLAHFEENQEFYLVQEFIEGHDLGKELTPGKRLSESYVIALLQNSLKVLEFVHQQSIIHRDIKPSNLMRCQQDGKIMLIDFGAVKQISTHLSNPQGMTSLTVNIGTHGYMPSEQAIGKPKLSSDVYALGIIGIQSLTGISPHQLPEDANGEIVWRNQVQVSSELADVLDKMVRYDFRQRYQSAAEALQAVTRLVTPVASTVTFPSPQPPPSQRRNRWEKQIAEFDKVIQINPNDWCAWYNRGRKLQALHRYAEAIFSFDKVIQINPNDCSAWGEKGDVLMQVQQYEEAVACYDKFLQMRPNHPNNCESWYYRGDALMELKRYPEALTSYNEAIQIEPAARIVPNTESPFVCLWAERVRKLKQLQLQTEAVVLCKQVATALDNKLTQIERDDPYNYAYLNFIYHAWHQLGDCLKELGRNAEADVAYNKPAHISKAKG